MRDVPLAYVDAERHGRMKICSLAVSAPLANIETSSFITLTSLYHADHTRISLTLDPTCLRNRRQSLSPVQVMTLSVRLQP